MAKAIIDPSRLAEELAANEDVLQALAANGDIAELSRTIDVHFKGPQDDIENQIGRAHV